PVHPGEGCRLPRLRPGLRRRRRRGLGRNELDRRGAADVARLVLLVEVVAEPRADEDEHDHGGARAGDDPAPAVQEESAVSLAAKPLTPSEPLIRTRASVYRSPGRASP